MGNEVAAIVDAILSLLPFEAGLQQTESALRGQITELYSAIVAFIDENLQDPSLSAHLVSENFGLSDRYVYRLFADRGLKLGAHVKRRRLEEAARELTLGRPRVTDLAYKWGFTDLSTFSRAFKEKFGCSPLEYRARY
jgi:AraC-like DNA-binding protein